MRYLGIDFGIKRVGLAVSGHGSAMAFPLKTIFRTTRQAVFDEIAEVICEEQIDALVLGIPLTSDQKDNLTSRQVKNFKKSLERRTDIPVYTVNEAYTSSEAKTILKQRGLGNKKEKDVLDQLAAVLILETFLASLKQQACLPKISNRCTKINGNEGGNNLLWNHETENQFFVEALRSFASPEQLFYNLDSEYYAYVPKKVPGEGQTLQSRNSLIGNFTEKWTKDIFSPIARKYGLYAVNGVVCESIGLSKRSNADLAFCRTNTPDQKPENIKVIFEIKMSIISNYKYTAPDNLQLIGDYKTHKGNPALLRSDSMLKAIGKAINIRVSGDDSTKIPIIILGNSPINDSYINKVDFLKSAGVVQGFWSLNPKPTDSQHVRNTPGKGFQTIDSYEMIAALTEDLLNQEMSYFSSMISRSKLGEFIRIANQKNTDEARAEKFLQLIREV